MNDDNINDFMPSILNPRGVRKRNGEITLTQNSIVSRCSLSLKRNNGFSNVKTALHKTFPVGKENEQNNKNFKLKKNVTIRDVKTNYVAVVPTKLVHPHKNVNKNCTTKSRHSFNENIYDQRNDFEEISISFSSIDDIGNLNKLNESSPFSFGDEAIPAVNPVNADINSCDVDSIVSLSSATDLDDNKQDSTIGYEYNVKPVVTVSFGVANCNNVNISTNNGNIKNINLSRKENYMDVDCEVVESSQELQESPNVVIERELLPKEAAVSVNLEFKITSTEETVNQSENSKVLILNTNAIEKLSHVIVQPPNYKLVKRQISDSSKFKNSGKYKRRSPGNESVFGLHLKQRKLDKYFRNKKVADDDESCRDVAVMSRNLSVGEAGRVEGRGRAGQKTTRKDSAPSPRRMRNAEGGGAVSGNASNIKGTSSEQQRGVRSRNNSISSAPSPRKQVDSIQFTLPTAKGSSNKNVFSKNIPHYKIVAGTHFAVDAFSYGDIPNVKHYFLTHFHSDHYAGLKKSFNKILFCSQVTADLCTSRLGVNPKYIKVLNFDDTITVEGVEVTAVDANHCPGALMLVFTLQNGKTLLHTGDFRASPQMESYPIFWNKDIHTIYLDSTYCNPRYDFPTQDQSLEMALYHLRQKKLELEKAGKKFSSVLIVCGTYTIGKEKFFLGMSKRVGCAVWACPEKERVLRAVEGAGGAEGAGAGPIAPPPACQLHVVPMRDLTIEKLRSYLDSLSGAFSEVVAFKPSGWENGKNSTVQKDNVTIHGIPYSEHSSFSEMIRFVKFLKPKQVVPTVDISGGVKAVQKFFPCPLVCKENSQSQSKLTDYFSIQNRPQMSAVT